MWKTSAALGGMGPAEHLTRMLVEKCPVQCDGGKNT